MPQDTETQEFIQNRDANLTKIEKVMQVAHDMLKSHEFSHEDISLVTGLSMEKIHELAAETSNKSE